MIEQTSTARDGVSTAPNTSGESGAERSEPSKTSPKAALPIADRAAYSPGEFASLFGRQQVWGYRQIYAGKVKVITLLGRMMIPATELKRLQSEAAVYVGREKKRPRNGGDKRQPAEASA